GVTRLDHLLITHSHQDHTGGFQWVAKELSLGEFWWSGYFHPTGTGERILAKVAELGIPVRKLKRGDELSLGRKQEVRIQVLNPPADMVPVDHDINNHSVVLRVSYGDIDFLLMGDAEIKAERMILGSGLAVDSEFLKLGHHGSDTASTLPFLKAVAPAFGVISCGRNNKYDHPHPSTLENLTHQGVTILRTDEVGTVVVRTDGQKVSVNVRGRRAGELLRLRLEDISHLIIGRRESTDEAMPGPAPCLRPDPDQWIRLGRAA
ncbi:MAG: MBL fold metallo-hydrolase, partial [Deltaproteobacteria bacterium]|nr:MBL fold metallo-hydrolase [Deltaproteobacteria bacterium]